MSLFVVPWYPAYDFTAEVPLNRMVFVIRFRFNELAGHYLADFFSRNMDPLMTGVAILKGVDFLEFMPSRSHPGGHLFISGQDPTHQNLVSGAAVLVYDDASL